MLGYYGNTRLAEALAVGIGGIQRSSKTAEA